MRTIRFFFFNDTATTEIYTLSLHDALPICPGDVVLGMTLDPRVIQARVVGDEVEQDRKSTRLNSSHSQISYAVFCLKTNNAVSAASDPLRPDRRSTLRSY